jgi:Protein of unknown function (DUF4238)
MTKKRHHYVPKTYLEGFTDNQGFLWIGRKDDPGKPLKLKPENTAFSKYYYSQTLDNGDRDNRMEDFFGSIEAQWPALRSKLVQSEQVTPTDSGLLWQMLGSQRVRVPAARDMMEECLAHEVMIALRQLDEAAELPPYPEDAPDIVDQMRIAIDPQKSIEGMGQMMRAFKWLIGRVGFEIVHNATNSNFVTSDNPVSIFDFSVPEKVMRPYVIAPDCQTIELLYPVNCRTLIRGRSALAQRHSVKGPKHVRLKDESEVRRINRLTAKFAYKLLIASNAAHSGLLRAYADVSPVLENSIGWKGGVQSGPLIMAFGKRPEKRKWDD